MNPSHWVILRKDRFTLSNDISISENVGTILCPMVTALSQLKTKTNKNKVVSGYEKVTGQVFNYLTDLSTMVINKPLKVLFINIVIIFF